MARSEVACLILGASVLVAGCGKSTRSDPAEGANAGEGAGASGGTSSGGSAGTPTGGSGGTGLMPYFHAGTRLKPIVLSVAPGVDIVDDTDRGGWFDAVLGCECFFAAGTDGIERCFPRSVLVAAYADPDCTRPAALVDNPELCQVPAPTYISAVSSDGCSPPSGYRVTGTLPASTPLYVLNAGTCEHLGTIEDPLRSLYELEAAPPETFVAVQGRNRPRHPNLDAYLREGADGSWQVVAFFDRERGACTEAEIFYAPRLKCLPPHQQSETSFGDPACEELVTPKNTCLGGAEILLRPASPLDCRSIASYQLYEIDEVRETEMYGLASSGVCVSASDGPVEVYVQGAPIDLGTLPTLEAIELGSGALRARFLGFEGVPFYPVSWGPERIVEARSGEDCIPRRFSDGVLRCVPSSFVDASMGSMYNTSPTCDGTRLYFYLPGPSCPVAPPLPRGVVIFDNDPFCLFHVAESIEVLGEATGLSEIYETDAPSGECRGVNIATYTSGRFLVLGETLDPDETFTTIERTVRD